jgi:hypothetical protein
MNKTLWDAIRNLLIIFATAFATAIADNLVNGKPLIGLTRASGLYQTFIKSSVPLWLFTIVLLATIFGLRYSYLHRPTQKGRIHIVPDLPNCRWKEQAENTGMSVFVGGTFTFDGDSSLLVLSAFLEGTRPRENMLAQVEDDYGRMHHTPRVVLPRKTSKRLFISMHSLRPVVGTPGKSLHKHLVLRDKYNRDFLVGPIEFSYMD